ncbi:hypothetical protein, partial [Salmonella sp. s58408]|uniref:hypothetical protein n=1 Tax=Salmonella sp. s58408 TaxID=3159701 RepID=UPI00397F83B2
MEENAGSVCSSLIPPAVDIDGSPSSAAMLEVKSDDGDKSAPKEEQVSREISVSSGVERGVEAAAAEEDGLASAVSVGEEKSTNEDLAAARMDYSAASARLAAGTIAAISPEVAFVDKTAAEDVKDISGAERCAVGAAVAAVEAPVDDPVVEEST